MALKRKFDDKAVTPSAAATFNARVLKKLQRNLDFDPEIDLLSLFPSKYTTRLNDLKKSALDDEGTLCPPVLLHRILIFVLDEDTTVCAAPVQGLTESSSGQDDIRFRMKPSDKVDILQPLSPTTQEMILGKKETATNGTLTGSEEHSQFGASLIRLLRESEIISDTGYPSEKLVVKCNADMVAKLEWRTDDCNEHATLQYLQHHKPDLPVPKPLGLVRIGPVLITFMSYLPGTTLEARWPHLSVDQKSSIRDQLDTIFRDIRTITFPDGSLLGGVDGQGCKDNRRHPRRSSKPILTVEEFVDFQFSNPNFGSPTFIEFLRGFSRPNCNKVVFTHGDFRPANVLVEVVGGTKCTVSGLIDWEHSGFYPDYHESTKLTNSLGTTDEWDWLRFLPPSISPHQFPVEWLLYTVWGRHME